MKKRLVVEGMSCGHCVKHVTEALSEVAGVSNVHVDLASKTATLEAEASVQDSALKAAVEDAGYDVVKVENA